MMTVSYTGDVATANSFAFLMLLLKWKGSVYKLLWRDLTIYLGFYYTLHLLYVYAFNAAGKRGFEDFVASANRYSSTIPLSFVLGFFVSNVMNRWWTQYSAIPWPTGIAVYVSSTIHGYDEVGRAMRRTIMRYTCLSLTMVFRVLSPQVQKRFPKMSSLIDAGLLHENELKIIEDLEQKYPGYSKNFLPIVWAASIVTQARKQGRIYDDFAVKTLMESLNSFRGSCGVLMAYNSISIPLVYTQVVTIATYSYFLMIVMGQQMVGREAESLLAYFPINLVMQFVFYMGWLKVAETLLNPFGEDDDDFDLNYMIDKNLSTSHLIVDDMHNEHPEIVKDSFWDTEFVAKPDDEKTAPGPEVDQDIIDFEQSPSKSSLKSPLISKDEVIDVDEETQKLPWSSQQEKLIPRPDVIDKKYESRNATNIAVEQAALEKRMEKIRRRTIAEIGEIQPGKSKSSSEDEEAEDEKKKNK